jgi:uncharacterized protein YgiM (DUF1202 family)
MIRILAVAVLCGLFVATSLAGESGKFPYDAKLISAAQVRCGPGSEHYVTQTLPAGAEVEIHRQDPDGWLAIRPPAGSFSWVKAARLAAAGETLARVKQEETVAWVGTSEPGAAEHKWQVRLKRDEIVEVLGRRELRVLPEYPPEEHCRIAPPSGEFRWIHKMDVAEPESPQEDPAVDLADLRVIVEEQNEQDDKANTEAKEQPKTRRDTFVKRRKSRPTEPVTRVEQINRAEQTNRVEQVRVASRTPSKSTRTLVRTGFEQQAKDIDLRIAIAASRSPDAWRFSELRPELNELTKRANTILQRARAQVLQDRLQEYLDLQARYAGLMNSTAASIANPTTPSEPPAEAPVEPNRLTHQPGTDPRFDGLGWLLPVHSSKRESPPYALLDKDGNILQFVSPAPGLNLHRYLRKEIGILGQRDQPRLLDKPHLTAHRVVNLARHR